MSGTKPYCISKQVVYQAYLMVKRNKGSYGVDEQSIQEFDKDWKSNLYRIWNRMSSGSYFPMAVKRVEIPKGDGKMRPLGIPTVSDRTAQAVVKMYIEPRLEKIFSNNSYGYRPNRSALDAVGKARSNCFRYEFVVDIDIKGFFDNIDHGLLMRAVSKHVSEKWILLYIERWLKAPVKLPNGETSASTKGTPQGGVISPILANLFLHYVMDVWLEKHHRGVPFKRYADDALLHFRSESHAKKVLEALDARFKECKLELNREKTKIVHCKVSQRQESDETRSFSFLGYDFKPRGYKTKQGTYGCGFLPAIGKKAKKRFTEKLRSLNISRNTTRSIEELANLLNPIIRGMMNYFGVYYKSELSKLYSQVDLKLKKWALRKYKKRSILRWLQCLYQTKWDLFAHWRYKKPTHFFG